MIDELLKELKEIGVEVFPRGETLGICPASRVPAELKERLRTHKAEVLAVLRTRQRTSSANAAPCRYDWIPGYRGLRLHCVTHLHGGATATVFRMVSSGRDVLLEMRELGILVYQALHDARRLN